MITRASCMRCNCVSMRSEWALRAANSFCWNCAASVRILCVHCEECLINSWSMAESLSVLDAMISLCVTTAFEFDLKSEDLRSAGINENEENEWKKYTHRASQRDRRRL